MVACFVEFAPQQLAESAESNVRSPVTKASYCWRSAVFAIAVFALEQWGKIPIYPFKGDLGFPFHFPFSFPFDSPLWGDNPLT